MTSRAKQIGEVVEYDEAEVRRRLGQVYSLLLDAARQKRAREAQQAATTQDTLAGGEAMT